MYHLQKHTAADGNRSCIPLSCTKLKPSKATDIFRAQVSSAGALKRFRAVCKINWLKKIQANGGGGGNPDHVPAESFSTVPVQPEVHKDLISKRKKKKKAQEKGNSHPLSVSEELGFSAPSTNPGLFLLSSLPGSSAAEVLQLQQQQPVCGWPRRWDGAGQLTASLMPHRGQQQSVQGSPPRPLF